MKFKIILLIMLAFSLGIVSAASAPEGCDCKSLPTDYQDSKALACVSWCLENDLKDMDLTKVNFDSLPKNVLDKSLNDPAFLKEYGKDMTGNGVLFGKSDRGGSFILGSDDFKLNNNGVATYKGQTLDLKNNVPTGSTVSITDKGFEIAYPSGKKIDASGFLESQGTGEIKLVSDPAGQSSVNLGAESFDFSKGDVIIKDGKMVLTPGTSVKYDSVGFTNTGQTNLEFYTNSNPLGEVHGNNYVAINSEGDNLLVNTKLGEGSGASIDFADGRKEWLFGRGAAPEFTFEENGIHGTHVVRSSYGLDLSVSRDANGKFTHLVENGGRETLLWGESPTGDIVNYELNGKSFLEERPQAIAAEPLTRQELANAGFSDSEISRFVKQGYPIKDVSPQVAKPENPIPETKPAPVEFKSGKFAKELTQLKLDNTPNSRPIGTPEQVKDAFSKNPASSKFSSALDSWNLADSQSGDPSADFGKKMISNYMNAKNYNVEYGAASLNKPGQTTYGLVEATVMSGSSNCIQEANNANAYALGLTSQEYRDFLTTYSGNKNAFGNAEMQFDAFDSVSAGERIDMGKLVSSDGTPTQKFINECAYGNCIVTRGTGGHIGIAVYDQASNKVQILDSSNAYGRSGAIGIRDYTRWQAGQGATAYIVSNPQAITAAARGWSQPVSQVVVPQIIGTSNLEAYRTYMQTQWSDIKRIAIRR